MECCGRTVFKVAVQKLKYSDHLVPCAISMACSFIVYIFFYFLSGKESNSVRYPHNTVD